MKIIIGLGNPGEKYQKNRHNAGFIIIDSLAEQLGLTWQENKKLNSRIAKNEKYLLIKPTSYMNNSGQATRAVLDYYKLLPKKFGFIYKKGNQLSSLISVIHDDVDISFGQYKITLDSGSAGHNGVQSIISHLKTKKIKRYRVGIKTDYLEKTPTEKFVLKDFSQSELENLPEIQDKIIRKIIK